MSTSADFEDIRNLKADYFRYLDAKRWSDLRSLFLADAEFGGFLFSTESADDFVRSVSGFLHDVESVHQGFMPRLATTADGAIRGVWSMHDYLLWPRDSRNYRGAHVPGLYGIHGYGFYEEEYCRLNGRWRISTMRLVRTRIDLLTGDQARPPMSGLIEPTPDWIPDA